MKILVTGSNGQLGNEIKSILSAGCSEIGGNFTHLSNSDVDYIDIEQLDISLIDDVVAYVKNGNYDVIINCAALTNVDGCETNLSDLAFKVNALGARNLAIAADKVGAKLVHVSTDYVFDGNASKPYKEWDKKDPQSVYGNTKSLGEDYVRDFCKKYFILRTSWLYGYVGKNFVKTMLNAGRKNGSLKVVNDQRGNPTNANDLAHHILKLITTDEYGIYHCTGNGECTWFEFTQKIIEYSGINATVTPCSSSEFPTPTKRPSYSGLDNMMLRNTIGDEMRNWQDALKDYIKKVKL